MKARWMTWVSGGLSIFLLSCSPSSDNSGSDGLQSADVSLKSEPAGGTVSGQPWNSKIAILKAMTIGEKNFLALQMYDRGEGNPCDFSFYSSGVRASVLLPKDLAPGRYENHGLGSINNSVEPLVVQEGLSPAKLTLANRTIVLIQQIDETGLKGQIYGSDGSVFEINGTVEAKKCSEEPLREQPH